MSSDALVRRAPGSWVVPTSWDEAERMAKVAAASQLAPTDLRGKPRDVMIVLMYGEELGLSPMSALRSIYVVKGKPTLSADAMLALVRGSDACQWWRFVELGPERVTCETLRVGDPEPTRLTWTIEDARRAGLLGSQTWKSYPRAMLRARCVSELARAVYPDVVAGLYTPEELGARVDDAGEVIEVVAEPVRHAEPVGNDDIEGESIEQERPRADEAQRETVALEAQRRAGDIARVCGIDEEAALDQLRAEVAVVVRMRYRLVPSSPRGPQVADIEEAAGRIVRRLTRIDDEDDRARDTWNRQAQAVEALQAIAQRDEICEQEVACLRLLTSCGVPTSLEDLRARAGELAGGTPEVSHYVEATDALIAEAGATGAQGAAA